MRAWQQREDDLNAIGGRLLVLSGDERTVLTEMVDKRGFDALDIAPASADDWVELGVQNERRGQLPHPTTLVLSGSGETLLREVHENFRVRTDPDRALGALRGEPTTPQSVEAPAAVDWENAGVATVSRDGDTVRFSLQIAPGFHAYGRKEQSAVPVYLRIDDGPRAKAPKGRKIRTDYGTSWVLDDSVVLEVTVDAGPVTGMIGWQLCTESACSAPRNEAFSL